MEELNNGDPNFQWGRKRGVGGAKKDVQFYGSFTLDGVSYALYDCVYLYEEGETVPYVGKILKIWEQRDHKKKVKILWFFRPNEIHNYLGDYKPMEKELFIASGEDVGLANINPLEAIAGKCSVICTSTDERNLHPSKDALERADFIFHCTFDVGTFTISDKLPEKIATIEVKSLLNREEDLVNGSFSNPQANGCAVNETAEAGTAAHVLPNSDANKVKIVEPLQVPLSLPSQDKVIEKQHQNEANRLKTEFSRDVGEANNSEGHRGDEKIVSVKRKDQSDLSNDKRSKKLKLSDASVKSEDLPKGNHTNSSDGPYGDEKVTYVKSKAQSDLSNDKSAKKLKAIDASVKPEDLPKAKHTAVAKNAVTIHDMDDSGQHSFQLHKEDSAKMKISEKKVKTSEEPRPKEPPAVSVKDNAKAEHQMLDVTRRPDVDRSKWFKGLPWEDRMQKAHEQGTLVFLQNFDPSLTSAAIEDIIYHTFKQSCTAKVIPLIPPYHNPHYGKAYVIFKTQDAANEAIQKINTGCLMLPNGSPLMASKGMLKVPPKATTLTGHLFISKVKMMQREEMRKAVSTSHCSQPNTIEYEMALDWILMQEKTLNSFNKLYKWHDDDGKKVKKNLKTKK